ncbi:hypothetical protein HNY73_007724 [Argiope bruennichi]|uniref:DUF1758 domain-containing protein n=1 Tax=Argiope bruennichi TaxID=94029 RepID=A0A8T0FEU9_ARGBR|nr:hypothetical protein HNY73_007724 [Argiope bruennichi]
MDKLSKLRKTRGLHRSSVTKYINKINSDLEEKIDSLTTKDLQEALNYLNISSTQLKDYDKPIQNLIKDDKEFETEIESAFEYNEKIIVCLSKLSAQLKCLQDESERQSISSNVSLLGATGNPNLDAINNTQESSAIVPVNEYNFKTIKLPKLTIEKYYGDPCCWLEFWNQFQNSIDNNKSLSKIDKFSYLKSLLGGAAAIAVNGFALSDENYDQALKLLKQRFGREELVINAHMSKLLNLVPVTDSNNIYGLRKLYDTVEINLRSLESLKVTSEMYGHLLYPILIKLIPEDLVLEFNRKKVDNSVKFEFNVTELLNFLRIEIECRESSAFMHTSKGDRRKENSLPKAKQNPFNNFSRNTASSHDILRSPRSSAKPKDLQCFSASALNENCLYCKGEHRSELCSQTDLETKLGVLKQDGRCFLCLKPKHRVNECRQRRYLTCEICGKKHNKSICSQAESNMSDLNKDNKNVITAISHYDKNKTSFFRGNIFLQTCAALVRNDETNEFETVRLMLDNGSMRTFITREVSEKLKLKVIRKESLSVYSFGAKQAKEHSYNIVRVELKNREDPSLRIEVEALVTENISATTLPAPNNNITKTYNKLKHLQLADIIDNRGKNISILIGVDYYYEIVSGRIKRLNNKLVATETIFGWCLQGHVGLSNDLMTMKIVVDEKDISDQLKQFWDLENLGVEGVEEDDFEKHTVDKEIMKQFEENIVYQNKRYTVKFPWKTNMKEYLANNFEVAKRRFSHLKSKFIKDNSLFLDYKAVIEDHLKESQRDFDSAFKISLECYNIFKEASMELRKWKTNSVELRDKWREAGLEIDEEKYSINDNSALTPCKVLGLAWDSDLDVFQFDTRSLEKFLSKKINSKRYVLQVAGRIFDPVGFLGPFTIKIKCLIQDIWCLGLDWDDPLPKTLTTKINEWCEEIKNLHLIKIPRYFFAEAKTTEIVEAQLHCFSDASKRAYGTVAYIRVLLKNGEIKSNLVASKSRVAPLKTLSIPRLELMGALLAARLGCKIVKCINFPVTRFFWTDSSIVYYWMKGDPERFKVFVKNRIKEIQNITNPTEWNHTPGTDNPADLISRGLTVHELRNSNFWWHGPNWLLKNECKWPKLAKINNETNIKEDADNLELKKNVLISSTIAKVNPLNDDLIKRYSSFGKLIRVTAWCLRFLHNYGLSSSLLDPNFGKDGVKNISTH